MTARFEWRKRDVGTAAAEPAFGNVMTADAVRAISPLRNVTRVTRLGLAIQLLRLRRVRRRRIQSCCGGVEHPSAARLGFLQLGNEMKDRVATITVGHCRLLACAKDAGSRQALATPVEYTLDALDRLHDFRRPSQWLVHDVYFFCS
jgi:hypothetical protein